MSLPAYANFARILLVICSSETGAPFSIGAARTSEAASSSSSESEEEEEEASASSAGGAFLTSAETEAVTRNVDLGVGGSEFKLEWCDHRVM